jgi:hypothetical protein
MLCDVMLPGLSDDELAMWLVYDEVSEKLASYCDPPVSFDLAERTVRTGARVVVIQVHEFADIPHLCARDYERVLRRGAPYVRSRKKPETAEIASSVEMRELLDLAAEKRLRAYVETAERAGITLSVSDSDAADIDSDHDQFEQQARRAWND